MHRAGAQRGQGASARVFGSHAGPRPTPTPVLLCSRHHPALPALLRCVREPPSSARSDHGCRGAQKANLGTLLRCCAAFNCQLLLAGTRTFNTFGAHGADAFVPVAHANGFKEAVAQLKARGAQIVGVEIAERAESVWDFDWHEGETALLLGNEGDGLHDDELAACDRLVYIPQYGAGTASLNVACAASIVLSHFAHAADFQVRGMTGAKFDVGQKPQRTSKRGVAGGLDEAERRRRAGQQAQNDSDEELEFCRQEAAAIHLN